MIENIPAEMRILRQWVCAGPNKQPINPRTGGSADVTDATTWATFEEARDAGYTHIGFVLSVDDPYSIIDLDEPQTPEQEARHSAIFRAFDSYSEISQSGRGIHIIVRGRLPSGVRRDRVEVYSDSRYMICTGNVLNNRPITDYQGLLDQMHVEMASTATVALEEVDAIMSDDTLYNMASTAENATKFNALWTGDLTGYPSQSEADFALLAMLGFYSKSDEQVRRMFRHSALGKRDKAVRNDDYLNRALGKIRAKQAPVFIDLTGLLSPKTPPPPPPPLIESVIRRVLDVPEPPRAAEGHLAFPPGLVGQMADYIFSSAIRPVREVALTAALALAAGVFGRCFNISNTGLNQYIVLLASTGAGKEGAAGGIDALLASIRSSIPAADEFLGPGTFASGQALTRVLDKSPCFVSVLGEIGITLQQICDPKAGAHLLQLRKVLLDLFAKSGWNKWLRPSVYSDSEKNTGIVRAPNVTILGESTPENFYAALDASHIGEGLVPRFLVIEYTGKRPPPNPRAFHPPDPSLVVAFSQAAQLSLTMRANETCCPVQLDAQAHALLEKFNLEADDRINNAGDDDVVKQLWNRAHIKALKLAGLIAVGCNVNQPIVTREIAEWALNLVTRDVQNMTEKFSSGRVGHGDHQQEHDIRAACDKYPTLTAKQRESYKVPKMLLEQDNLIPYVFLKRYLSQRASFKNDRRGAVVALTVALEDMLRSGMFARVPAEQAKRDLLVDSPVYYRGEAY